MIKINEIGNKYGKLTVIEQGEKSTRYGIYWICLCDCGATTQILGTSLRSGKSTACGCNIGYNTGPKRKVTNRVLTQHFSSYRNSKKAKSLGFDLSLKEFEVICRENCYYCGSEPQIRKYLTYKPNGGAEDFYSYDNLSGIDRFDNAKGYVEGNCIPCCAKCNLMKKNYSEQEFLDHIFKIYEHSKTANLQY